MTDYLSQFDDGADDLKAFDGARVPEPLPGGVYAARTVRGEFTPAEKDAGGRVVKAARYRITFEVLQPEAHAGKTVRRTWTFSEKAIGYARRDLALFGLDSGAKLLQPFPAETTFVCKLTVAHKREEDGREFNDVKGISVLKTEPHAPNPFALGEEDEGRPGGDDGAGFPFGANAGGPS